MKKDIHPPYQHVVFEDINGGHKFLTRSSVSAKEEIKWEDGQTYPLVKVQISLISHPFYLGKRVLINSSGKVERFMRKYNIKKK